MGLMFLIVVGAVFGWLAAIVLQEDGRDGLLSNGIAGIAGALLAGLLVSPALVGGNLLAGRYSVGALLISLLGSLAAIAFTQFVRHRKQYR